MIGYALGLLREHVLDPQGEETAGERRVVTNPDEQPLDVAAQSIDLLATRTVPIGYEIGGGMELRHTIDVGIDVQHGDATQAGRLRDLIVLDLCLRATLAQGEIMAAPTDPASGQSVSRVRWEVDYRPLYVDAKGSAVVTFTIDTDLDVQIYFAAINSDPLEGLRGIATDGDGVPYVEG